MALYVWLDDDFCDPVNKQQWPNQIDVWTEYVEPKVHRQGWQVVNGHNVVDAFPWRHLPATLYRVEVEEPYDEDDTGIAFARAMLVERYGRLDPSKSKETAIALMTQVVNYYQHPSFYRGPGTMAQIDEMAKVIAQAREYVAGNGPSPLDRAVASGYPPLVHMARSIMASSEDMAWVYAARIGMDIMDKPLRLDMARGLIEVLE